MASILDSREEMKKLDKQNVLGSVEALPKQIQHVWETKDAMTIPAGYEGIERVVVSGMGGSALGARVIKSLFKTQLRVPFEIVNHYKLPGYVDEKTLVVLSSYSGTTEETLSSFADAQSRGAKLAAIASGGTLEQMAIDAQIPFFKIDPVYNPSNQPRMGIGYAVFGQLVLFSRLGLLSISDEDVLRVITALEKNNALLAPESIENNNAKFLAYSAVDKMVALVSAEHLEGAAHVMNNQCNENAKNLTMELVIPEMNHHLLEALSFPKQMKDSVLFLLFQSRLYSERVMKRVELTRDVIEKNGFPAETVLLNGATPFEQVWEVIQLGAYTNFYLSMLNGIDPAPIPWVDYFKEKMGK